MKDFKFAMEGRVHLAESSESGLVIARAEHLNANNQYQIRYLAGDGRQVEVWWDETALIDAE